MAFQGDTPDPKSSKGKQLEKIVSKNPFLRKMRAQSRGEKAADITTAGDVSQQYKDNYDKIDFTKRTDSEKPKFKTHINGVLQYPDDDNDNS